MSDLMIKGIYRDRLLDAGGQLVFDSEWKSNLIVTNCRVLLAGFMSNEPTAHGVQKLEVGEGDPAWDTTPPPAPPPTSNSLVDNSAKFTIPFGDPDLTLQYLNDSDAIVPGPTSRIEITATLGPDKPSPDIFNLREFGLFGELNGESFMIDYVRHPVIQKSGSFTLERRIRLIF
jgi:hypothetical protein